MLVLKGNFYLYCPSQQDMLFFSYEFHRGIDIIKLGDVAVFFSFSSSSLAGQVPESAGNANYF